MATKPKNTETKGRVAARHRSLRNGGQGRALVRAGTAGAGRAIGQQNRLTRQAKENLEEAFFKLGGTAALVKWAKANKGEFYTKLWARLIPKDVQVNPGQGLEDLLTQLAERRSNTDAPVIEGQYSEVTEQ